jgi:hypothetical protein
MEAAENEGSSETPNREDEEAKKAANEIAEFIKAANGITDPNANETAGKTACSENEEENKKLSSDKDEVDDSAKVKENDTSEEKKKDDDDSVDEGKENCDEAVDGSDKTADMKESSSPAGDKPAADMSEKTLGKDETLPSQKNVEVEKSTSKAGAGSEDGHDSKENGDESAGVVAKETNQKSEDGELKSKAGEETKSVTKEEEKSAVNGEKDAEKESKNSGDKMENNSAVKAEESVDKKDAAKKEDGDKGGDKAKPETSGGAPATFQCEKCKYNTRNKVLFDNHFCDNEDEDNDLEETTLINLKVDPATKTYQCSECNISGQGHAFEEHLMCHIILRPYKCLYCSLCFVNRREIGRHLAKVHAGQKMNCALRALRRAKALMSAALESGTYSFYARVAGKVPLSSDKYRAKLKEGAEKSATESAAAAAATASTSGSQDGKSTAPAADKAETSSAATKGESTEASKSEASEKKPAPSAAVASSSAPTNGDATKEEVEAAKKNLQPDQDKPKLVKKVDETSESQEPMETDAGERKHETAKKEEAMEVDEAAAKTSASGGAADTGETPNSADASKAEDASNFDQSEEEASNAGLKIVAAFSLRDDANGNSNDSDHLRCKAAENSVKEPSPLAAEKGEGKDKEGENSREAVTRALGPPSTPIPASSFFDNVQGGSSSSGGASAIQPNAFFFFMCGFPCSFSSLTSPEFRDHLMLDHAGETAFPCYHCGYLSQTEDGLVRHISAHAHTYSKSAPLYICGASACKFGSNLVGDFVNHQSWHSELTAFHCHDCDERFDAVDLLLKHFEANFLHVINCPHCTAKATQRRLLLAHIGAAHPGKAKMVSVAKQVVCRDRKLNSYTKFMHERSLSSMVVPDSPPPLVIDAQQQQQQQQDAAAHSSFDSSRSKSSLVSILTEPLNRQEQELTKMATRKEATSIKKEPGLDDEEEEEGGFDDLDDSFEDEDNLGGSGGGQKGEIAYMGSKPDDREVDNFKCKFCTFIARDRCRLEGHERCHGLPPSRKSRFKCMYCPQGFNNDHKFTSHVSCHPGLIKFALYKCKRCDFDSNQRHIMVKHVRSTRDQQHMGLGVNEDDMYTTVNKTMETRVLECTQCSYMTRHRKHLVAHIKRDHASPRKTGITVDCDILEQYPHEGLGAARNKALEMAVNHDRASFLPVGDDTVRENQARRFKCPICQYLVPRAADLKAHVKRHSEIGEITLVMFRCKYCSAASTAREIVYGHLMEKHLGKQIALVKRIVTIDTKVSGWLLTQYGYT